jgi:hypothetical protein
MRFRIGAIPETPDFVPAPDWKPLREPGPLSFQLLALPIAIANAIIFGVLWVFLTPLTTSAIFSPLAQILAIVMVIPIHELVHAAVHPGFGFSPKSKLGVWPSRLLFYAHYTDRLSRNRFIAILAMPLLVISVAPLFVSIIFGRASSIVAVSSIFNALAACGDVLGIILVLFQTPRSAMVCNQGWKTYWTSQYGR